MRINQKALESYGAVKVQTGVSDANSVQLIQMLFDGLLESLSTAKGHIQHKDITEKSKALTRAGRIVLGLQNALDFEKGGELACLGGEVWLGHAELFRGDRDLCDGGDLVASIDGDWHCFGNPRLRGLGAVVYSSSGT